MSKWQYMLLISSFITSSTCSQYLVISRTDQDIWTSVNHSVVEMAGSKLYLTCSIQRSEEAIYKSFKLVWGRRTPELRFKNTTDLETLARQGSKQLLDLDDIHGVYVLNRATKTFDPLTMADRGTYFCMNLRNFLFKIVRVKVTEPIKCNMKQFRCDNGKECIPNYEVCDNKHQCTDHSDEKSQLCDSNANGIKCTDHTIPCGDHCIPAKWCCDRNIDSDCFVTVRNSCCPPLLWGSPYLVISRTGQDIWTSVNHSVVEMAGSKLSLTCSIQRSHEAVDKFFKLVWGRRTPELRFENTADLVKLAREGSKQLLNLDDIHSPYLLNRATKTFDPLTMADRGTYFCMNLRNFLFKIVRVKVKEPIKCNLEQFRCDNGEECIPNYEVCDSKHQCTDHSDEKSQLCESQGIKCAEHTIPCRDHCIPTKWCCDRNMDSDCFVTVRNSCCPPLPGGDVTVVDTTHNDPPKSLNPQAGHNIILAIASVVIVLTVCLVIYFAIRERNARDGRNSNNQNGVSGPPIIRTDDNHNSMILSTLMGITGNGSREYLDLPPTYADSTRNTPINSPRSSCRSSLEDITIDTVDHDATLPPTYDEALAKLKSSNVSLSAPPDPPGPTFLDVPNVAPGTSRDDP